MSQTINALIQRLNANRARMETIQSTCATENRTRNAEEDTEYQNLQRDNQQTMAQIEIARLRNVDVAAVNAGNQETTMQTLRRNAQNGVQSRIDFTRALNTTSVVEEGGIAPVHVNEVVRPLEEQLITSLVGLPFSSGLSGDFIYPVVEAVEATVADEGVELTDTPISMSKLSAKPQRIGLAVPITREALNQSDGLIEQIARELMPAALARLINKMMFSPVAVANSAFKGPFAVLKEDADKAAAAAAEGEEPEFALSSVTATFKSFNLLKAELLKRGVSGDHLAFVMTKARKAELEATPKFANGAVAVCEKDMICGVPVFTTEAIGDGYVGIGDFTYQPMGLFGEIYFTVDPFSKARKNAVDFVLNANYATTTLRKDAFILAEWSQDEPTLNQATGGRLN